MNFTEFFRIATGHSPYPYQVHLACGEGPAGRDDAWLTGGHPGGCDSRLIEVPTGLGKTAGVVLAWVWNRGWHLGDSWPRRLVYCLPMRTLVEQTRDETSVWLKRLAEAYPDRPGLRRLASVSPVVLMGGEEPAQDAEGRNWDIRPEDPAIVIGTQDMLLSRALNRGYGMSRYRWPMHFGLLNNDCLWVMDETQLMGVGLDTGVQLAGFRERFGTLGPVASWWMSATLDDRRLATPEAPRLPDRSVLSEADRRVPAVRARLGASKRVRRAATPWTGDAAWAKLLAREVREAHVEGSLTLVIVNRVERAQEICRALRVHEEGAPEVTLVHGRFRPYERGPIVKNILKSQGDRIVVSTQVVEAGVDLSARTLFTELAPWSSMVQRFGRCHRHGEMADTGADIVWIELPDAEAAPYPVEGLAAARRMLGALKDASPTALRSVASPVLAEPVRHLIRPKDLRDLFDTTPDVAGVDIDISRYIRDGDETDCAVFWREGDPDADSPGPVRNELCPVPVGIFSEFGEKHRESGIWTWDALNREWVHPDRFLPGRAYWVRCRLGGYEPGMGFDRRSKVAVEPLPTAGGAPEADDSEVGTTLGAAETLASHSSRVVTEVEAVSAALNLRASHGAALRRAAVWHDAGKAHPVFQAAVRAANPALSPECLWAKSGSSGRLDWGVRRHFRHELASALAFRGQQAPGLPDPDLVAYLIAAHHGRVRLSMRAVPGETEPPGTSDVTDRLFARGIWDGDELPAMDLDGVSWPSVRLSLAAMQLGLGPDGKPSWTEACLALRDSLVLGPFRLGYLEAILRAADARASMWPAGEAGGDAGPGVRGRVGDPETPPGGIVRDLTSASAET